MAFYRIKDTAPVSVALDKVFRLMDELGLVITPRSDCSFLVDLKGDSNVYYLVDAESCVGAHDCGLYELPPICEHKLVVERVEKEPEP
jgi:hypothetical protein